MKRLWPLLIASIIGIAILCSLGAWQLRRLEEKTRLIATLEARMNAEPISLADAMIRQTSGEDIEYLKVQAAGQVDWAYPLYKITTAQGKPAWEVIAPFRTTEGLTVLLDLGTTAEKLSTTKTGSEVIVGIVRRHQKGKGFFDHDNDKLSNVWYWWDLTEMAAAAGITADSKLAPFIIQKLPSHDAAPQTVAQAAKVELNNNHLGYAITWFGLAAALLAVAGFFMRSLMLDRKGQDS